MKKPFICLFLFLMCLKLSASIHTGTILKYHSVTSSDTTHKDSLKAITESRHIDSLRSLTSSVNSANIRLFAASPHHETLGMPVLVSADTLIVFPSVVSRNGMATAGFRKDSINLFLLTQHADSLMRADGSAEVDSLGRPIKAVNIDSINNVAFLLRIDTFRSPIYTHLLDSLKHRLKTMSMDSLKQELQITSSDLFKAPIYTEIAARYADYDTLSNERKRAYFQFESLNYTMLALHKYSLYNDTLGLRSCFDNLSNVYLSQGKFSQAKWFAIQSNTLSRAKKDYPGVINSLIKLAAIKSDIKDYKLAMRDLNEALQIATVHRYQRSESLVLKNFGLLYSRMQNYDKEAVVLKKRDSIEDALRKEEAAALLAKDSKQIKKLDSLQAKKKVYTSSIKKNSKGSTTKKTVSL